MKYKVGDKVRIKSKEWFDAQEKDEYGYIELSGGWIFGIERSEYCGRYAIITGKSNNSYDLDIDNKHFYWTDEMFEDEPTVYVANVESKAIDWGQRRYELAKYAMQGILSNSVHSVSIPQIVSESILFADEMIKQLKNK